MELRPSPWLCPHSHLATGASSQVMAVPGATSKCLQPCSPLGSSLAHWVAGRVWGKSAATLSSNTGKHSDGFDLQLHGNPNSYQNTNAMTECPVIDNLQGSHHRGKTWSRAHFLKALIQKSRNNQTVGAFILLKLYHNIDGSLCTLKMALICN